MSDIDVYRKIEGSHEHFKAETNGGATFFVRREYGSDEMWITTTEHGWWFAKEDLEQAIEFFQFLIKKIDEDVEIPKTDWQRIAI